LFKGVPRSRPELLKRLPYELNTLVVIHSLPLSGADMLIQIRLCGLAGELLQLIKLLWRQVYPLAADTEEALGSGQGAPVTALLHAAMDRS
jgi:hypothetical protein